MISVSRLLCDEIGPGDELRYGNHGPLAPAFEASPIVVWNCTRRCNLNCVHCYASAQSSVTGNEMNTEEGKDLIRQLADFRVPVLLFSGGEPLLRKDFFELAEFAVESGIGVVVSTNGTLITPENARQIQNIGFREVGISLDGIGVNNDQFRGKPGAYDEVLAGVRNCIAEGQRVSLRMTITRANYQEVGPILDLVERERIDRVCFYHLAYAGRGNDLRNIDLTHRETREVVDLICDRTLDFHARGMNKEILLVANHTDGVYLYLNEKAKGNGRAEKIFELLRVSGGNNSGIRIGSVDETGNVHPDQFWRSVNLGNVRERSFGDIWLDTSDPVMAGLKDRRKLLKGRCGSCRYVDICNGNLRERAEAVYGDMWAEDPACYLTNEEIGITSYIGDAE